MFYAFLDALTSLSANKLRSALTALGIIIGVAAVVGMLALGNGTQDSITGQIESIGTNLLYVMPDNEATNHSALTTDDADAILRQAPSVQAVAPIIRGQVTVSISGEGTSTSLVATTPDYLQVENIDLSEGIWLTDAHMTGRASVAVLGPDTAENLFGRSTGVTGQKIRIDGQIFRVIGVTETQGGTGFNNPDDQVIVPLTTAQARLLRRAASGQVDSITVQAVSSDAVDSAEAEVTQLLRQHHNRQEGDEDVRILNTQSLLETVTQVTNTFTLFLGGIGGISLLVGGIGIMNIMLVSVVERTREIGLRKAVGARKRDVLFQFLVEASLLSLSGGLMGIGVGWGLALLIGRVASLGGSAITPVMRLDSVVLAVAFSAAVGIFFGIYPASRAANLEPVEALRTE
ncbi:MAG: ABC transporter permease [Anaerolineales bacterium]